MAKVDTAIPENSQSAKAKETLPQGPLQKYLWGAVLQRFLYIVTKEQNTRRIMEFRQTWGVDTQGFASQKDCAVWENKAIKNPPVAPTEVRSYTTVTDYEFFGKIYRQSKPRTSPRIKRRKLGLTKLFNANFHKAISDLAAEIKLDDNWHYLLFNYLLFGSKALNTADNLGIKISVISQGYQKNKLNKEKFILTITPNTRRKDILELWKNFIEKRRKLMAGYINMPSNHKVKLPE